ncbi:MAG TPA: cysteine desulfurase family protein [Allosphingosinicella sp.]|jgi:cysteine desulfurase
MAGHGGEAPGRVNAPIYLDYQATAPLAPEAAAAMRPWLGERFANPHSSHRPGREAAAAVEVARDRILNALQIRSSRAKSRGARDESVPAPLDFARDERSQGTLYFTSGATEAANWALKGAAARLPANRRRIVTLATEHACVLDTVEWLGRQGFEVDVLPVRPDGVVDLASLDARVDERTGIVAAMLVNNEIGIIQPVAEIGALARSRGALFFCDAVQGFGRVSVPLDGCDMVALSAHKVHGPKGIGALWVRDGTPLDPLLHGGGQEGGLRSGTLSPALCAGFGEAARLLVEHAEEDRAHVEALWEAARAALPGWTLNGAADPRYHGNLNIRRESIDSTRLISEVRGVAFSAGSACASGSGRPSHVLAALGLSKREARSSIRLGFGRTTSEAELLRALASIDAAAGRQLSFAA